METGCSNSAASVSPLGHFGVGDGAVVPGVAGPDALSPREVLRGVFAQHSITECIDWFTGTGYLVCPGVDTGDLNPFEAVKSLCEAWWGAPEAGRGCRFYRKSLRWASGARIDFTDAVPDEMMAMNPGRFKLVLSGSVLSQFDGVERIEVLKEFWEVGHLRVTRLDLATDFTGEDVRVVDLMLESTARGKGELRGFQMVEPHVRWRGEEVCSLGVTLGRRGKNGSGRMVRAYDKGLESGERPVNEWQRVEVEYTGDLASLVWASVAGDGRSVVKRGITEHVLSEFDFRVPLAGGRRPRRIRNLKRTTWWEVLLEVVGKVGERIRAVKPRRATLKSYLRNFRRCYVEPWERLAFIAGCSVREVIDLHFGKTRPRCDRGAKSRREFETVELLVERRLLACG